MVSLFNLSSLIDSFNYDPKLNPVYSIIIFDNIVCLITMKNKPFANNNFCSSYF